MEASKPELVGEAGARQNQNINQREARKQAFDQSFQSASDARSTEIASRSNFALTF